MKLQRDDLWWILIGLAYGAVCGFFLRPHFGWPSVVVAMVFPFAAHFALNYVSDWRIETYVVFLVISIGVPRYRDYRIRTVLDQDVVAPMRAVLSASEVRTRATGKRPAAFEELGVARPAIPGLQRLSFDAATGSVSAVVDSAAGQLGKLYPQVNSGEPVEIFFMPVRELAGAQSWSCHTTDVPPSSVPSCKKAGIRFEHKPGIAR